MFYDQKALFTALLQLISRKSNISIEKLKPVYRVMKQGEEKWDLNSSIITNSFFISGLYLNGASWSNQHGCLDECQTAYDVSYKLPTIHMLIQT
jgi:hypothetical protein